ncbi:hypothetical protein HK099_005603 [Clydaea vesicula]|uniref:Uncharacterized protein n=1 Tax=Clydaea vesicula TaxID=447962 RepID=A0AAD5XZI0_9FUNG|nr:hypothetical protein HK099_005603 [Clydaea vesicula]
MNDVEEYHETAESLNEKLGNDTPEVYSQDQLNNLQKLKKQVSDKIQHAIKNIRMQAGSGGRVSEVDVMEKPNRMSMAGLLSAVFAAKKLKYPLKDNSLIELKAKAAKAKVDERLKFTGYLFNYNSLYELPSQLNDSYVITPMSDEKLCEQLKVIRPVFGELIYWENLTSALVWSLSMFIVWFLARFNFSPVWLVILIFYVGGSMKRNNQLLISKLGRSVKEELADNKLKEADFKEEVEWFNTFLSKYWANYEPGLSAQIQESINFYLRLYKPTFLEDMLFTTFSLGSEAPRIENIRILPKTEEETIFMDVAVSFIPFDEETKPLTLNKKQSKLELKLFIGKGGMTVAIPTIVKNVSLVGTMQASITLSKTFPHIKFVDICFKEIPVVNFDLRPLKGLDLMDLPGLNNSLYQLIKDQLKANIVDPVKIHLPLEEWAGALPIVDKPIGVLKLIIYQAKDLKNRENIGQSDPYTKFILGDKVLGRTKAVHNNLNPKWGSEHFIIIYESFVDPANNDSLYFEIFDENEATKDKSMGRTSTLKLSHWIKLAEIPPPKVEGEEEVNNNEKIDNREFDGLSTEEANILKKDWGLPFDSTTDLWKPIFFAKHEEKVPKGELKLNLLYFPLPKAESFSVKNENEDIESGIVTITVHQVKDMAESLKATNMCVVCELNTGEEVGRTEVVRKSSTPVWDKSFDIFVKDVEGAKVKLNVLNNDHLTGNCILDVSDILDNGSQSNDWYKLKGIPSGKVRVTVKFVPVDLEAQHFTKSTPSHFIRICIREANGLKNVEMMSKSDPYCSVTLGNQDLGRTCTIEDNLNPTWRETFNVIACTGTQLLTLLISDFNGISKDKILGHTSIRLQDLVDFNSINKYLSEVLSVDVVEPTREVLKSSTCLEEDQKEKETLAKLKNDGLQITSFTPTFIEVLSPLYRNSKKAAEVVKGNINFTLEVFPIIQNKVIKADRKSKKKRSVLEEADTKKSEEVSKKTENTVIDSLEKNKILTDEAPEKNSAETFNESLANVGEFERVKLVVEKFRAGILNFKILDARDLDKTRSFYCVLETQEYTDPGAKITHSARAAKYSTKVVHDSVNPSWNEAGEIFVSDVRTNVVRLAIKYLHNHNEKKSEQDKVYAVWNGKGENLLKLIGQAKTWLNLDPSHDTYLASDVHPAVRVSVSFYPVFMEDESNYETGELQLEILEGSEIDSEGRNGHCNPLVVVKRNSEEVFKTKCVKKTSNPIFHETVNLTIDSKMKTSLKFEVFDHRTLHKDESLGYFDLALRSLPSNESVLKDFKLLGGSGRIKTRMFFSSNATESQSKKNSRDIDSFGHNFISDKTEQQNVVDKELVLSQLPQKQSDIGDSLPPVVAANTNERNIRQKKFSTTSAEDSLNVVGEGTLKIIEARNLKGADSNGLSDHNLFKESTEIGESHELDVLDLLYPNKSALNEAAHSNKMEVNKHFDTWLPIGDGCGEVHLSGDFCLNLSSAV